MSINIQRNQKKRVVIVGGGLGGLRLAEDLYGAGMQVVLIDKNNFHQFPPLIYQIASAGIDPSSISFPFRQIFRKRKDFYFRMAEARMVDTEKKILQTSIGKIDYDYLVLAAGATTNFFGNKNIEEWAIPMKTVPEAMGLRNALLSNFERALTCATEEERQELLNVVIVGGGATGVDTILPNCMSTPMLLRKSYAFCDDSCESPRASKTCSPSATSVCRPPTRPTLTAIRRWRRWLYSRLRTSPRTSSSSTRAQTATLSPRSTTRTSARWLPSDATRRS